MNIIDRLSVSHGLCAHGVCTYDLLLPHLSDTAQVGLMRRIAQPRSVFVALFPYAAEQQPGNLSLYARGRDYHAVIQQTLRDIAAQLRIVYPQNNFVVLADDSPLPEVLAAAYAGLGCIGAHGLLIHPLYGSYVFIGTIVTDCILPTTSHTPTTCINCGSCRRACPIGLDKSCCLSALTQQGGTLTDEQAALVRVHPLIWGCDTCQLVCPMNRTAQQTPLTDFRENHISSLSLDDIEGLTRKQFLSKYPERAFTWRGPAPIRRNLLLKQGEQP